MINGSFVFGMDGDGPDVFGPNRQLGYQPGHRDGHVPYPHPVPGHRFVRADGGAGPHPAPGLGPLRHPHRRIPARRHGPADPGIGLLARLQRLLPMGINLDRSLSQGHPPAAGSATSAYSQAAGRNSSPCGTSPSDPSKSSTPSPCSNQSSPASAITNPSPTRRPPPPNPSRQHSLSRQPSSNSPVSHHGRSDGTRAAPPTARPGNPQ